MRLSSKHYQKLLFNDKNELHMRHMSFIDKE